MIDMNKKYKYRNAPEGQELRRILCTDRNYLYSKKLFPVLSEDMTGIMHPHTICGGSGFPVDADFDLIEITKYDHIKKGDLVMVWDVSPDSALLRKFAFVDDGKPYTKIVKDSAMSWQNCELIQDYAEEYLK